MLLPALYGLLLGVGHLLSDRIHIHTSVIRTKLISFSAGVGISFVFLELLPMTYRASAFLEELVFLFLLVGFALFHLVEKYIYQHAAREKLRHELKEEHAIAFFAYYFIVGIALIHVTTINPIAGTLFFIPLLLHSTLSSVSMKELHGRIKESIPAKTLLSSAALLGMVFSLWVPFSAGMYNAILSFIAGVFLYIMIREFLPEKRKGQPLWFILGIALFAALIYLAKFLL